MFASALTSILFSLSIIFGGRSAKLNGAQRANLLRITLAAVILGTWAHLRGSGIHGPGFLWFFLSGVIGFGFGDLALFGALPRIGPRLSILLTQCLAAPIAAWVEWIWLGEAMGAIDMACAGVIIVGVAVALAPDHGPPVPRRVFWIGVLFGAGSAMGQGLGAVLSRKAIAAGALLHVHVDGGSAAYQRALGGALLTWLAAAVLYRRTPQGTAPGARALGWALIIANALAGPVLGVSAFQWALQTNGSGLVLPVVATSPLVTVMLAWWIDGIRPSRRAVVGGMLAVAGAAALAYHQVHK